MVPRLMTKNVETQRFTVVVGTEAVNQSIKIKRTPTVQTLKDVSLHSLVFIFCRQRGKTFKYLPDIL